LDLCSLSQSLDVWRGTGSWDEPYGVRRRESWNDRSTAFPGKSFGSELWVGDLMFIWGVMQGGDGARCQRALCSNLRTPGLSWLVEKPLIF